MYNRTYATGVYKARFLVKAKNITYYRKSVCVAVMSIVQGLVFDDFRVDSMAASNNLSVESVVLVRCVFYRTNGTVWFQERVFSLYGVPFAYFLLGFVVAGFGVFYSVFEFVFRGCLQ